MQVKYVFLKTSGDPNEFCDVTLEQEMVPRKGELVDFNIQVNDEEYIDRMGRVDDVTWQVGGNNKLNAVVFIA